MTENVFFLQILSNISGSTFVKVQDPHLSILGAAYLAGLTLGVWKDETELEGLFSFEREFTPAMEEKDKIAMIKSWKQAVASAMLFSLA
jgi:glycerol kinase